MSYCRFGPGCDVYVYESVHGGIVVNVASATRGEWWSCPHPSVEEFLAQHRARMAWCESHPGIPITLPEAGAYRVYDDVVEVLRYLLHLRNLGYLVPQYALDALREDAPADVATPSEKAESGEGSNSEDVK